MRFMRIGMILAISIVSRCQGEPEANYGDSHIQVESEAGFYWPTTGKITQDFYGSDSCPEAGWWIDKDGSVKFHEGGSNFHRGIDIGNASGTKVYAAHYGYVSLAVNAGSGGNVIRVKAPGGGFRTSYSHLASFSVANGEFVTPNTVIGTIGATGEQAYPHLHFAMEVTANRNLALSWLSGEVGTMVISGEQIK